MIISSKKSIVCACTIITAIAIFRTGMVPKLIEIAQGAQNQPKVASVSKTATEQQPNPISQQYTPLQRAWIDKLEACESGGHAEITIFDSNSEYSYGILQFQMDTFMAFGKKYGFLNAETTITDALKIIHDVGLQEAIAGKMLTDGLQNRWQVCYHKINEAYPKN
jgi:hypothetical protein